MEHELHKFEFVLLDSSGNEHEFEVEDVEDSGLAYNEVREQICSQRKLSIAEFEREFDVADKKHKVSFRNPPWDDGSEIKADLESIDGVSSAAYISPYRGAYGPPKFYLTTSRDYEDVRDDVKDYYEALGVEDTKNGVYVIVSPRYCRNN